jgi:aryl-phospho-beta-D-glucosidase BglC (GH1 family)
MADLERNPKLASDKPSTDSLDSLDNTTTQSTSDINKKGSSKGRRYFFIALFSLLVLGGVGVGVYFALRNNMQQEPPKTNNSTSPIVSPTPKNNFTDRLIVRDRQIVFSSNGTEFYGRGVNLGSWFNPEGHMLMWDGLPNEFAFFNVSDEKWGEVRTRELMHVWIDNFMGDRDFKFIKDLGFNFVRLPLHYRNFQWRNTSWVLDDEGSIDFSRLDRALYWAELNNLYVQIVS